MRGTKVIWKTGNTGNQDFDFGEQGNKASYFWGIWEQVSPLPQAPPPWPHNSSYVINCLVCGSKTVHKEKPKAELCYGSHVTLLC